MAPKHYASCPASSAAASEMKSERMDVTMGILAGLTRMRGSFAVHESRGISEVLGRPEHDWEKWPLLGRAVGT
jgi:hypothetical protein